MGIKILKNLVKKVKKPKSKSAYQEWLETSSIPTASQLKNSENIFSKNFANRYKILSKTAKKRMSAKEKADQKYAIAKQYEKDGHPRKAEEYKEKASIAYKNATEKIAVRKTQTEYALQNAAAGAAGGAVGAIITQPIDTIATIKQYDGSSAKTVLKKVFKEGIQLAKNKKLSKGINTATLTSLEKSLGITKRLFQGLGVKTLKIAPATGAAFAVHQYLTKKTKHKK